MPIQPKTSNILPKFCQKRWREKAWKKGAGNAAARATAATSISESALEQKCRLGLNFSGAVLHSALQNILFGETLCFLAEIGIYTTMNGPSKLWVGVIHRLTFGPLRRSRETEVDDNAKPLKRP